MAGSSRYQVGARGAPRGGPVTPAALEKLDELQQKIGIAFRDPSLLLEALTHSSFANENPLISPRDNERLEYLGDAVLQLITAEYLYKMRPDAKEGEMTQVRSAMVNTNTLAALSEELGVGEFLFLGKGIAKGGGRNLRSLLANAFEAVLGAIFLDAGYDAAYHYCLARFKSMPDAVQDENFKGRLQQVVQERFGVTPYYDAVGARGPGGRMREYTAVVYAGGDPLGTGHGRSKQTAEQLAARDALEKLLSETLATKRSRRSRRRARSEEQPVAESDRPVPVESVLTELEPEPEIVEAAPATEPPTPRPRRRRSRKSAEEARTEGSQRPEQGGAPEPEENRTEGPGQPEQGGATSPSVRFPEPAPDLQREGGPELPPVAPEPETGRGQPPQGEPAAEPRPARRSRRKRPAPEPEPSPASSNDQAQQTPEPEPEENRTEGLRPREESGAPSPSVRFPEPEENRTEGLRPREESGAPSPSVRFPEPEATVVEPAPSRQLGEPLPSPKPEPEENRTEGPRPREEGGVPDPSVGFPEPEPAPPVSKPRRTRRRAAPRVDATPAEPTEPANGALPPPQPEENRTEGLRPREKGGAASPSVRFPEPENRTEVPGNAGPGRSAEDEAPPPQPARSRQFGEPLD